MEFINCGKENVSFIEMRPIICSMDVILYVNNYPDQLRKTFEVCLQEFIVIYLGITLLFVPLYGKF